MQTPIIPTRALGQFLRAGLAIFAVAAFALQFPLPAAAQTNTLAIAADTLKAVPSCTSWKVRGVCSWLSCSAFPPRCSIKTSFRVQHYIPEVVVSTWHDPTQHPWGDFGRLVAAGTTGVGSAILALPIDSAGTPSPANVTYKFRDADAIGNPLVQLPTLLATGKLPSLPKSITVPTYTEMSRFPGQMGAIANSWGSVPATLSATVVADSKRLAAIPDRLAALSGTMNGIPGKLSTLWNSGGQIGNVLKKGVDATSIAGKITGVDLGPLKTFSKLMGASSGGLMSTAIFCPGGTTPFGINFQSQMDGLTWRSILPVEMLYPQAWVPGMAEVGSFPSNTWGSVFPRDGNLTQSHPVKNSAVLASRVADIITKSAQPHIYKPLAHGSGFKYFGTDGDVKWQRLYPNSTSSCGKFGANDSLSLTSYGDGNTSAGEGYAWNMWLRVECCQDRGSYLGSITW